MPSYQVTHSTPLTEEQKQKLAEAISHHHATAFSSPQLIVYVSFHDGSQISTFQAGKPYKSNRIVGAIRNGPTRTREQFLALCKAISKSWEDIVENESPAQELIDSSRPSGDKSLHAMILTGDILAGIEFRFVIPPAGQDGNWMKETWGVFEKRAEAGDEPVKDMMVDVKKRGLV